MSISSLTSSSLKSLEVLYAQVPKTKENYSHYIRLLVPIVEKIKEEQESVKRLGVLLVKKD